MNTNEHLRPIENHTNSVSEKTSHEASLAAPQVENVFRRRVEMLSSIEGVVAKPVYVRIAEKLLHERETLLSFIETDAKVVAIKKKSIKILDSNFFVQKSLDINTI